MIRDVLDLLNQLFNLLGNNRVKTKPPTVAPTASAIYKTVMTTLWLIRKKWFNTCRMTVSSRSIRKVKINVSKIKLIILRNTTNTPVKTRKTEKRLTPGC